MSAPPAVVVVSVEQLQELVREAVASSLEDFGAARSVEPDLVDGAEMARRLSVSRTTLHRLRVAGMPAIPVGDTFRYRPSAVVAWLESRAAQTSETAHTEPSVAKPVQAKPGAPGANGSSTNAAARS
jgi:hypothetical protein